MLFNSLPFALFFICVVCLYFSLPQRRRWVLLLASSYYFYMCWKAEYVLLIMLTTTIDFSIAQAIHNCQLLQKKRRLLLISLISNLGILFGFKYFNFLSQSLAETLQLFNIFIDAPFFQALLPVGISFYTFQSLSYVVDVYRGKTVPEKHLGYYALYVSFWPQLVAGPIERSTHLLPQLRQHHLFDPDRITDGLRLMLVGLVKKVVIADQLAPYVNKVYGQPEQFTSLPLLLATLLFAAQIYCDFSGYTDMARGSARVMGYDLMENFRQPYFATSIRDFWQRWHISLSTWFRDYVYIAMGGNRQTAWRWYASLLATFLLSGLWHGANWTFVIWGGLHGCYLILENLWVRRQGQKELAPSGQLTKIPRILFTFLLVCLAWVFFRASSVSEAITILARIGDCELRLADLMVTGPFSLMLSLVLLALLVALEFAGTRKPVEARLAELPRIGRWVLYLVGVWTVALAGLFGVKQQFIYFQF